jgi:hypothetical protein
MVLYMFACPCSVTFRWRTDIHAYHHIHACTYEVISIMRLTVQTFTCRSRESKSHYTCIYAHTNIHTYVQEYMRNFTHAYIVCSRKHTHVWHNLYTCKYIHMHTSKLVDTHIIYLINRLFFVLDLPTTPVASVLSRTSVGQRNIFPLFRKEARRNRWDISCVPSRIQLREEE